LSGFDDTGRIIMGMSADQVMEIKEQDENRVTPMVMDYFQEATCKTYEFRVKAKMETFQDQPR
jgi:replication factor A1